MATVTLQLPHHRYDIRIEPGALNRIGRWLREVAPHTQAVLLADHAVFDTFGQAARKSIEQVGYDLLAVDVPISEKEKNLQTVSDLYDRLLSAHIERNTPVVALGGGVMGDTAGFVAATCLRGLPFIQCPTTLLAMVDASVGGKVGVNVTQGKNLVGSFHQPVMVVIDTDTLQSLPDAQMNCGLAECVKHGMIADRPLFDWIGQHLAGIQGKKADVLVELVQRNVQIKADVVMADEKEAGVRAHLNLGHTFGHAIEATSGFGKVHHGQAVSLGMVAATQLAVDLKRCDKSVLISLVNLLEQIGLPVKSANLVDTTQLIQCMKHDKKVSLGKLRLVLPTEIGQVAIVQDPPSSALEQAWESIRA